jgi:hypothetical protein
MTDILLLNDDYQSLRVLLRDGDNGFCGSWSANLACNLAKRTHAPNLVMIYEAGVIGAEPARLPLSIRRPNSGKRRAFSGEHVRYFRELSPARQRGCGVYGRRSDR